VSHLDESEGDMTPNEGRERGERRAEHGIKRAAFKHEPQIRRDSIRFLDALLSSATGCATLDDATDDLQQQHADGGKWRASIPKRLRADGLIVAERVLKSARPARHAGYLTEWRLIDRNAAVARRSALAAEIKDAGESAATDSPAVNSSTTPPNGE
jgi:hypothetical protein